MQYRAAKILPKGERERRETPMRHWLQLIGWLACVIYSTIPAFWLMIHPFAGRWRARHLSYRRSPYPVVVPLWVATWIVFALITRPWRATLLYRPDWPLGVAALLFVCGMYLYSQSGRNFSAQQLGGIPEVHGRSGLLGTDRICSTHGSGDDSTGGCGVGEEVWGRVS